MVLGDNPSRYRIADQWPCTFGQGGQNAGVPVTRIPIEPIADPRFLIFLLLTSPHDDTINRNTKGGTQMEFLMDLLIITGIAAVIGLVLFGGLVLTIWIIGVDETE